MGNFADLGINIPYGETGAEIRCICPQCTPTRKPQNQKEKDLCVNTEKGTWICQHCGWAGGLKETTDKDPVYTKPAYKPSELPKTLIEYFQKRGISENTLKKCNIGYLPRLGNTPGAIMFPRYKNKEVVAIKYRTFDKRMWQSKNPEPCFYNHDGAIASNRDVLIIVEGEPDCLAVIECGKDNVVSVPDGAPTPNAKNLTKALKFLDDGLIDRFQQFIIATDNDDPGQFLANELTKKLGVHRCLKVEYPAGCKDLNDVLVQFGKDALLRAVDKAKPFPVDGLYSVVDVYQSVIDLYRQGLRKGLSTGWQAIDEYYTVRTCELTIVTGIPGSGKSTWLDNLVVNLNQKHGWKIAFCSPENWPVARHVASIIEKFVKKPFATSSIYSTRMSESEALDAMALMDKEFFFIQMTDDEMNISNILNVMHAAISRHGVKGIVLDPWNELEYRRPIGKTETEFVSEALGQIRRFARLNDVHVWIVAHPTKMRKNEDGTYPVPTLYDCSGSANFYNKADNGISIYRRNGKNYETEVWIQKIRFKEVGKIGSVGLHFSSDCGIYHETQKGVVK